MNFKLDVVSITGEVFSGEVKEIILPAVTGQMTVLAKHMPIVAPLDLGEVVVKEENKTPLHISIGKGVFSFDGKAGKLLIEDVATADDLSEERILVAKEKAEEILKLSSSAEERLQATYQIRKSLVDLKVVRRKKTVKLI